jgi:hypothetical protein
MRRKIMDKESFALAISTLKNVALKNQPFNLYEWKISKHELKDRGRLHLVENDPNWDCGYCACAIGHIALDPAHQKRGFILDDEVPRYRSFTRWKAVSAYFSITEQQAFFLFDVEQYNFRYKTTVHDVIDRMESFLENAV